MYDAGLFWLIVAAVVILYVAWPKPDTETPKEKTPTMIDRSALLARAAKQANGGTTTITVPAPKRGAAIFENADSPRTWDAYIGQAKAKKMLKLAIKSAQFRKERMGHILIASASPGIGKSALARLTAAEMGAGVVEIQDTIDAARARAIIGNMKDGDVLIWDEFHQALNNGKKTAEWLLPFLQDGTLPGDEGLIKMPEVTIIAATTDYERIPETIMSRFGLRPQLENYTPDEYRTIARMSSRTFFDRIGLEPLTDATLSAIANASASPRLMKNLMANLRDCEIGEETSRDEFGNLDLRPTLSMMGLTHDGLTTEMTNYMLKVFELGGGPIGGQTIWSSLDLPERPVSTEGALMQRGLLQISSATGIAGRSLTQAGKARTLELLKDEGLLIN